MSLESTLDQLAAQIAAILEVNARAMSFHKGKVVDYDPGGLNGGGTDKLVKVVIDGAGDGQWVPHLDHFTPQIDDILHLVAVGPLFHAVGRIATVG